jgi:hypothetical protein
MARHCAIEFTLDFQDLGDFALCLFDIAPEAEGRREFQMNVPDARRKHPRSSKRFHSFIDAAVVLADFRVDEAAAMRLKPVEGCLPRPLPLAASSPPHRPRGSPQDVG